MTQDNKKALEELAQWMEKWDVSLDLTHEFDQSCLWLDLLELANTDATGDELPPVITPESLRQLIKD